ncbi:hypothetical protein PCYB_005350, partial [Plasmodium cynomolgi strain B]
FHKHIHEYIKYEEYCLQRENYNEYANKCKLLELVDENEETKVNTICLRFQCLMNYILKQYFSQNTQIKHVHLEYLNYWLNNELHNNYADIFPKELYQHMKVHDTSNTLLSNLDSILSNMNDDEIKNMSLLFYLYRDCVHIVNVTTGYVVNESFAMKNEKHCADKYKELEQKCPNEKTASFCKAFCAFKKKYKSIDFKIPKLKDMEKKEKNEIKKRR